MSSADPSPRFDIEIASDAAALPRTFGVFMWDVTLDTESEAATDDCDTITGGDAGQLLMLHTEDNGRDITIKDNVGNLKMNGDMTLSKTQDRILFHAGGSGWREVSRSPNA